MKLFIASDIHGSAVWCRKMIDKYTASGADKLLLLGDILYHGPRNDLPDGYSPREVIAMLKPFNNQIICVRGNCDADIDCKVLGFPIIQDYTAIILADRTIFATHGHKYNRENLSPLSDGDILLHGHTHVPMNLDCGNYTCVNPGSVSIPKDNSPHSCMIFNGKSFELIDLSKT